MIICTIDANEIQVVGHANQSEYGSDIVCSAVSMLTTVIANQLLIVNENFDVELKSGEAKFRWNELTNDEDLLIETLLTGIQMLEENYQDYFKIKEVNDV